MTDVGIPLQLLHLVNEHLLLPLTSQAAGWTDALNEFAYAGYEEANNADAAKPKPLPKQPSMANVFPSSPANGPSSGEPALSSDPELSDL